MSDANHHDDDSIIGNSIQQDLDYDSSEEMGGKGKNRTDITVNTPTMLGVPCPQYVCIKNNHGHVIFYIKLYMFCMICKNQYKYI